MRIRLPIAILAVAAMTAMAQTTLNNDAITKMVKGGLSDDVVIGMVKSQPAKYSTTPDDLIALKSAGVSDKVIAAMVEKMNASGAGAAPAPAAAAAATPPAAPSAAGAAGPVREVGVYYKKGDIWTDLNPEVVNFKTGGVLKTIGTAGIVKGDVNGHVNGEHSKTQINTPVSLLVYTPEGVAITEYQLLRLHESKDAREFRTITGGVMHVSGGATRDLVPFDGKKIAPRTYEIQLTSIGSGEFGLLPPTAGDATGSSGRIGKIYSFHVLE